MIEENHRVKKIIKFLVKPEHSHTWNDKAYSTSKVLSFEVSKTEMFYDLSDSTEMNDYEDAIEILSKSLFRGLGEEVCRKQLTEKLEQNFINPDSPFYVIIIGKRDLNYR